jgi:hypothetical protein
MRRQLSAAALAGALWCSVANAAIVQQGSGFSDADVKGPEADAVKKKLDTIVASAKKKKFTEVKALEQGVLKTDGPVGKSVVLLDGKTEYLFSARGDGGCKNVDLILKDSSGNSLASDREADANPSFRWTSAASGAYILEVIASKCAKKQLQAGAVVIAKGK